MRIHNATQKRGVGPVCRAADFRSRLLGMLFADPGRDQEPLWIFPCRAIHTVGMRYPLDVIFLSRDLKVLRKKRVDPFCLWAGARGTHSVIEFFSGRWNSSLIEEGDQLEIQ